MQIKLCKLHNAKQIIRDKLRKYIKNHQLSQIIELKLSEKGFYTPFPTSYKFASKRHFHT